MVSSYIVSAKTKYVTYSHTMSTLAVQTPEPKPNMSFDGSTNAIFVIKLIVCLINTFIFNNYTY